MKILLLIVLVGYGMFGPDSATNESQSSNVENKGVENSTSNVQRNRPMNSNVIYLDANGAIVEGVSK